MTPRPSSLAALAIGACMLAACDRPAAPAALAIAPDGAGAAGEAVAVRTAVARREPWPTVLMASGSLEVDVRSTLGAKVPGRVSELLADVGSEVKQSQVLARVDDVDYRLRVAQVESQVHQARALLGLPLAGDEDEVDPEATAQVRLARAVLAE